VDVGAHLFDNCLQGCWLTYHINFLCPKLLDPFLDGVVLSFVPFLFFSGVETDENFEHFVISQPLCLFCQFVLDGGDLFSHLIVAFLHGLVVAEDGLADFLLEICEEALDDGQHLGLSLLDAFLNSLLFLRPEELLVSDFLAAVREFLGGSFEEGVDVVRHFVDAELEEGYFSNWPYVC